ncbi:MAG: hypothetical protein HUK40_10620 [Desulfobacter sp.]|nr:hypothetical protein [Desulfobacter sp.]
MTTIIIVTLFLVSVIGFGLLMNHLRQAGFKAKKNPVQAPPKAQEKSKEDEFKEILETLLKLNLIIRKDREVTTSMVLHIEQIIDDLKAVIPAMMERYPGETLTYELKKIGKTHLNKTVKEFLDLSLESRKAQMTVFELAIQNLHDVCHRSREIVEKNETAEFKTMAHFLEGKF